MCLDVYHLGFISLGALKLPGSKYLFLSPEGKTSKLLFLQITFLTISFFSFWDFYHTNVILLYVVSKVT